MAWGRVNQLIIEVPALSFFMHECRRLLNDPEVPTIDISAVVSQIAEIVCDLTDFDDRLANAVQWMSVGEGLFERTDPDSQVSLLRFTNAVVRLATAVKNKLLECNVYSDNKCEFTCWSIRDDTTILLSIPQHTARVES